MIFNRRHRELAKEAEQTFKRMARELGLKPQHYRRAGQWIKDDANRLHIVQLFNSDGGLPVVLKQAVRPEDPAEFQAILSAHKHAQRAFDGQSDLTVPQVLAEDADARAYLMTFQPGKTLLNLCRERDDHGDLLRRVGAWVSAYHSATMTEAREFVPRFMADHITLLADQIDSGARHVREGATFVSYARQMHGVARDYTGQQSKVAAKHGDLNAHNILISDSQVAGYDFLARSDAPVGYDIARLLLSYAESVGDLEALSPGAVMPDGMLEAFFEGYGFVPSTDPGVQFMLRVQVLTDWNRLSPQDTFQNTIRFARIAEIARHVFA